MNICVIGTGYVGLVTGTCFAYLGRSVTCCDIDNKKINSLSTGEITFFEPGLEEKLKESLEKKNISFSSDIESVCGESDVIFIAVGTPSNNDGSADLSNVFNVAEAIGNSICDNTIVVIKSTVPVGTAHKVERIISEKISDRSESISFDIVNNPEFLREGRAVLDFMSPDRIIIGSQKEETLKTMEQLYHPFSMNHKKIINMDILSSEMTKYASNAMLASRISFMNEVSRICELVGADVNQVRSGMGSDQRIGYHYLYPSVGYGGSCFPKDLKALANLSNENNYNPKMINAIMDVNKNQIQHFTNRIKDYLSRSADASKISLGVWGLSFKPNTDDIREAPSIYLIRELLNSNANISVYDPKAMENCKTVFEDNIVYSNNKYDAIKGVDCLILLTEWEEFRCPDFHKMKGMMNAPVIFDGRNIYGSKELNDIGFNYYQIGVKKA